mgnify:CR=1 FL=1
MKPALAFRQPYYPKDWQELPNGDRILAEVNQILAPWWPKFFGYHLLKIGALSHNIATNQSTIRHQITVTDHIESANIVADVDDLPLLQHSVDVAILSHVLEYAVDPHHVVREANRVLIPNGYLVITGFNPFSLVGLNKIIPYRRQRTPWNERFFSAMRVKDWLHLMGYEILHDERCLHSSLEGKFSYGVIARNWRKIAAKLVPSLGSIYVIIAKKRVLPLTPIKPKWKLRAELTPINVSTLNSSRIRMQKERNGETN